MGVVISLNVGTLQVHPGGKKLPTAIRKTPVTHPVRLTDPGPRQGRRGTGSALAGDHIGDRRHHGGYWQAVYAFAREELDVWQQRLGRELPDGAFGENLTTRGIDVDAAVVGEVWRIGGATLKVTCARIPCATFTATMGVRGWAKTFTAHGRTGVYLAVREPGAVCAGDQIEVTHRPDHGITVEQTFRIVMTDKHRREELLPAAADLHPETLAFARS